MTYPYFTVSDIATFDAKVFHASQGKLPKISRVFAARCNERQWDISMIKHVSI